MIYEKILRPILFLIDPEQIHKLVIKGLGIASHILPLRFVLHKLLFVTDSVLKTKIGQINLDNPVGLAAGFDKYIEAPQAYPMIGFGFAELGSITQKEQTGNPRPRMWRIPDDHGLIIYYGLSNGGLDKTENRLKKIKEHCIPYGLSIAPTTGLDITQMADDYVATFLRLYNYVDYITLNVSCPNVASCEKFAQVSFIKELVEKIRRVCDDKKITKDIFIKIGSELTKEQLDEVVDVCVINKLTGIIATNLIKDRNAIQPKSTSEKLNHPGGISGGLLKEKSNAVIRHIYRRAGDKLKIIGVGGIFTAEDVYEKIKCGASAVQMITGWIYGGPFVIGKINRELVKLLERDGYKNIGEAVGKGNRTV